MLRAAGLLQQGQPFAYMAFAQQAAHFTVCKPGPQAGAPGTVLTSISSLMCVLPSVTVRAQVVSKYSCEAEGCQKRALYNFEGERSPLVCGQHKAEGMASPARASLCTVTPSSCKRDERSV